MNIQPINEISFGRKLREYEKPEYSAAVKEGLAALGKELDIIVHSSNTPSAKNYDTGVGSSCSVYAEEKFYPFLEMHGFSKIQAEPDGLRKASSPTSVPRSQRHRANGSPYESDTFAKNILMIPLEKLVTPEYGNILSKKTYNRIVNSRHNKSSNKVDYHHVMKEYDRALSEAYKTYKTKVSKLNTIKPQQAEEIQKMVDSFWDFEVAKGADLETNAIFTVLTKIYGNDDWAKWSKRIDRRLFSPRAGEEEKAKARIAELKAKHRDEIDFFLFKQMLVDRARKETAGKTNLKTIGDAMVAFSYVDVWANQDLFLKDLSLGCPPDYFSKDGQAWGFAMLKPETLFDKDGSLGKGGKLLHKKYQTMFEDNPGGVRIDHIIGLVDPFVYSKKPTEAKAGRLYSSPDNQKLKQYTKKTTAEYANIVEKIVIAAAKSVGMNSKAIIAEDLGTVTKPTADVIKHLKLRGIAVTEFTNTEKNNIYRGKNVPKRKVIMVGSHDNPAFVKWTDDLFKNKTELAKHAQAVAADILPPETSELTRKRYINSLIKDKEKFRTAKFAELFTSKAKEVQVFFTDFFGMKQRYNLPGTNGDHNWTLRIPQSFERTYHENLEHNRGLNMPEVIAIAIRQKGKAFADKHSALLRNLDKFKNILKEKD